MDVPHTGPSPGGKSRKTLKAIYETPSRANIKWNDFVALMTSLGTVVRSEGGSAHIFLVMDRVIVIHKPHPGDEMVKPVIKRIRAFLSGLGIRPPMMKYKDYVAKVTIDDDSGLIYGEVVGPRDVITFQGETVAEARRAFAESVDLYLKVCDEHGREPDKPFNGVISYRTDSRVHRLLYQHAKAKGLSLNEFIDRLIRRKLLSATRGPR